MAILNKDTKDKIVNYVNDFYRCEHHTPSVREIAAGLGIGKSTVHNYLVGMNELKELVYDGKKIETDVILKCNSLSKLSAPILGSIGCGDPTTEEENIEEYVNLPESIFGKGDFYILHAYGDSMLDAGIEPGVLVVVDKKAQPQKNDIFVVLNSDNENTLKQYKGKKIGKYVFAYMYEEKYPGETIELESFVCQGVAKHMIKSF